MDLRQHINNRTYKCYFLRGTIPMVATWKPTTEFTRLGVDPKNPGSYRAEALWYFGHVARLQPDAVTEKLLLADRSFEVQALSYHVIDLAHKVLRKHRWVNAGWILTALALITLAAAGTSFFIHVQFG